jgi:FKBP-type peptidyl-prolyl cis-trans isomerase (trigger factor)
MLENQIKNVFEEIKQNLQQQNQVRMADYLASLNMTEEQYKEQNVKPVAEKRLFGELVLHKLLELEGTTITDEEVAVEAKKILARFENADVIKRLEELYTP